MSTIIKIIGIIFAVIGFGVSLYATYEYENASTEMGMKVMSSSIGANFLQYGIGGVIFGGIGIGIFYVGVKI